MKGFEIYIKNGLAKLIALYGNCCRMVQQSVFLMILVLLSSTGSSLAQEAKFSFQSKLSADSILIGDHVELTINASVPKGYNVQFPYFSDTLITGIEILGLPRIDTLTSGSGNLQFTYRQKLTSFDEGYYRIPPIRLPFTDGNLNDTAQTAPIWFLVNTMPPDTTITSIHDIKLPLSEPYTFAEVAPWVGGGLLIIALVVLIALYLIKRKKNEPLFFSRKPVEPPHIIALRGLVLIRDQKLWNTQDHKHYHTILTDIIRTYIERRFNIPAMEQTTDETIQSFIKQNVISDELIAQLKETLSLADLVKFAKLTPTVSENEDCLKFGFRLVNETKIEVIEDSINDSKSEQEKEGAEQAKELSVEPIKKELL